MHIWSWEAAPGSVQDILRNRLSELLEEFDAGGVSMELSIAEAARLLGGDEESVSLRIARIEGTVRITQECAKGVFPVDGIRARLDFLEADRTRRVPMGERQIYSRLDRSIWRILSPAEYVIASRTGTRVILYFRPVHCRQLASLQDMTDRFFLETKDKITKWK